MRLAPGQRVEPKALITLRPRYGMKMIIETREQALAPTSGNVDTTRLSA
jgi:hypothetical protein